MRILLTIEYDGTNYAGWQRQNNALSIQEVIENAIEKAVGHRCIVHVAGRTDAGVHAYAQRAHFDVDTTIPPEKISYALNLVLPEDIRIKESRLVSNDFHSRFCVKSKHYRYSIYCADQPCAIGRMYSTHVRNSLNVDAMKAAAAYLKGTHDFAAFQAAGSEVKDTVRTIDKIEVTQIGNLIYIDVMGKGFLYNMVRIIAGTLIDVGRGRYNAKHVLDILASKNRENAGATAPAKGLALVSINYGYETVK